MQRDIPITPDLLSITPPLSTCSHSLTLLFYALIPPRFHPTIKYAKSVKRSMLDLDGLDTLNIYYILGDFMIALRSAPFWLYYYMFANKHTYYWHMCDVCVYMIVPSSIHIEPTIIVIIIDVLRSVGKSLASILYKLRIWLRPYLIRLV